MADNEIRQLVLRGLILFAVGGNGFFVKRLVDKIDRVDSIEKNILVLRSDVARIKAQLGIAYTVEDIQSLELKPNNGGDEHGG